MGGRWGGEEVGGGGEVRRWGGGGEVRRWGGGGGPERFSDEPPPLHASPSGWSDGVTLFLIFLFRGRERLSVRLREGRSGWGAYGGAGGVFMIQGVRVVSSVSLWAQAQYP